MVTVGDKLSQAARHAGIIIGRFFRYRLIGQRIEPIEKALFERIGSGCGLQLLHQLAADTVQALELTRALGALFQMRRYT